MAVDTAGALKPLPTAFPKASGSTGFPNIGGLAPPSQNVVLCMAVIGLTISVIVIGFSLLRRRKTDRMQTL